MCLAAGVGILISQSSYLLSPQGEWSIMQRMVMRLHTYQWRVRGVTKHEEPRWLSVIRPISLQRRRAGNGRRGMLWLQTRTAGRSAYLPRSHHLFTHFVPHRVSARAHADCGAAHCSLQSEESRYLEVTQHISPVKTVYVRAATTSIFPRLIKE